MKQRWRRGLTIVIGLLLVCGAVAAATVDGSDRPTPVAAGPRSTSTTTEDPTTTTEAPTTTTEAPVTAPPTTRRPAAPRVTSPRPPTTRKPAPAPAPRPAAQPSGITAMFYYGWYPSAFQTMGSRYHPTAGSNYDSSDPAVVRKHIDQMRYAGMQAGIASWWGQGHMTDKALAVDIQQAHGTPFKWTVYYEREGPTDPNPTVEKLRSDLQYIRDTYTNDPNWLYVDGKPVIFVWPDGNDRCEMVDRWNAANTMGFYVVQKRFPNNAPCINRTASWHDYSPDLYRIEVKGYSFSVGPGFYKYNESPRLARNPSQFESATAAMAASSAPWKLVTTFNEWNEGTAVEPAEEWASPSGYGVYLDILHKYLGSR